MTDSATGETTGSAGTRRRMRSDWLMRHGKWFIILPPMLYLLMFFLIPFWFALKISFADTALRVPPFTDILSVDSDWHIHFTLSLANFRYLFTDELYGLSYIYSMRTAFFSTLICLLLGYPMAYAIARTSKSTQNLLLLVIILPFWTSFLLRVYALEGIIRETGLLNSALLWLGIIHQPLKIMHSTLAVYLGIIYSYLPFMVLPLFATLEKLDHSLNEAAADLGSPPCGPDNLMIGRVLWDEFFGNRDWPVASAVAVAFLILLVGPIALYQHYSTKQLEA
jgi:putrescine transport system permease protein